MTLNNIINHITIDNLIKFFAILGFCISFYTLYFNFLKPGKLDLKIGKRIILIWHDKASNSSPMIDVFCTFLNTGANPVVVESICIELRRDGKSTQFNDIHFLTLSNGNEFMPSELSHPIIVNKYSTASLMIAFKNEDLKYQFEEGRYELIAKANFKNKIVAEDKITFDLTPEKKQQIYFFKGKNVNSATEILP